MWKGFGTDSDASESKSHGGYFRPRIASISEALHNLTKQRFLSPPSSVAKNIEPQVHFTSDNYGFDTGRINGSYLIGAMIAGGARASIGELIAYSRSASARASIDSTAAHGVYDIDFNGDKNSNDDDGDNNENSCSRKARNCSRGLIIMTLITLSLVGTLHLIKLCYENGKFTFDFITNHTRLQLSFQKLNHSLESLPLIPFSSSSLPSSSSTPISTFLPSMAPSSRSKLVNIRPRNETTFDAPFFMAWCFSIWNILFLPIFSIFRLICFSREKISTKKMILESIRHFMERGYSLLQFFTRCGLFCALLMLSNYLLIFSIRRLDTTVVMALFACSVSFFYILSWVVLHQQFVGVRIVAVIICDTGIALLAYMNGVDRTTLSNVFLVVLSSLSSAVYKVFYRRTFGYISFAQVALFSTLIGFMNAFLMWPIVLILYFAGLEILHWNYIPWLYITAAAALFLTANILGSFGLCWTYEVFLSLGLLLAIPASAAIDAIKYHVIFEDMKLSGVLLIMFGFSVVLLPNNWNHYVTYIIRSWLTTWKTKEVLKKNGSRVQDTTTAALSRLRTPSGRVK